MPGSTVSVIAALTDHSEFAALAAALAVQSHRGLFELIVLTPRAEAGRDLPREAPRSSADSIPVRQLTTDPARRGAALNAAVELAEGELLVILGDDLVPEPDWLKAHVEFHADRSRSTAIGVGAVRCLGACADADGFDSSQTEFGGAFGGRAGRDRAPNWFERANTSVAASLLWRAGLFDDDLPEHAVEDYELSLRLLRLHAEPHDLPRAVAGQNTLAGTRSELERARSAGQLLARLDEKYGVESRTAGGSAGSSVWRVRLRAALAAIRDRLHSTEISRAERRRAEVQLAAERGYAEMRRRDRRQAAHLARFSVPLPAHIEAALAGGSIRWSVDGRRGGQLLYPFDTGDSELQETTQAGRACLQVSNPQGHSWAYLRVDPIFAQRDNRTTVLTCEILAPPRCPIWIEYDSNDRAVTLIPDKPGAFKRTQPEVARGRWQTLQFTLPDLHPQERINTGDFRIVCGGRKPAPFFLRSVEMLREIGTGRAGHSAVGTLQKMGFRPEAAPRTSVVIPVHNHLIYTLQCLQSLAAHPSATTFEVIVVDDASTDGSAAALRSIPGLRVFDLKQNLGFTGACRHGAAQARGEFVLFLNNDTVAHPGWLDEMLAVVDAHPDAGAVGSRLIYPQTGKEQHIGIAYDHRGRPYHLDRDGGTALGPLDATWPVPAVTGACLLTPRSLYESVDGFDPLYDQECQDIDYCCKVAEAGFRIYYCGTSVLLHYESVTRKEIRWAPDRDVKTFLERWALDADGFQMHRRRISARAA